MHRIFILVAIGLALAALAITLSLATGCKESPTDSSLNAPAEVKEETLEYGIPIDSFYISTGVVRRNQTLSSIMASLSIAADHIRQLPYQTQHVLQLRSVRAGNPYRVYSTMDTNQTVRYLVYEHSITDHIVFDFTSDTLQVRKESKEVIPVTKLSEAEINSSLWDAMRSNSLNPVLALDLSDVFAWTVDFFGLHKGDRFKVLYDELYVDGTPIGVGTIHAAWFEHRWHRYYAFRFEQDSTWSYWDQDGNSLRKAFLKAPLRFSRISSRFTHSRKHPILKIYRPHTGVDYAAPEGTPVVALGDGIVVEKGYNNAAGNYVKIRHNSVYTSGYNHFSRFGKGIAKGVRVAQGQVIGYVGRTGYATGPHLDLRFWKNGKTIDPLSVEAPPVEPIRDENREAFLASAQAYRTKLDSISLRPVIPAVSQHLLCN